eukprot:8875922-Pyramimonas_sp.AAC.1
MQIRPDKPRQWRARRSPCQSSMGFGCLGSSKLKNRERCPRRTEAPTTRRRTGEVKCAGRSAPSKWP